MSKNKAIPSVGVGNGYQAEFRIVPSAGSIPVASTLGIAQTTRVLRNLGGCGSLKDMSLGHVWPSTITS